MTIKVKFYTGKEIELTKEEFLELISVSPPTPYPFYPYVYDGTISTPITRVTVDNSH